MLVYIIYTILHNTIFNDNLYNYNYNSDRGFQWFMMVIMGGNMDRIISLFYFPIFNSIIK